MIQKDVGSVDVGVVLNPCKAFSIRVTSADMDVCVLLQWRKAAKARRKVCERFEYHYVFINI